MIYLHITNKQLFLNVIKEINEIERLISGGQWGDAPPRPRSLFLFRHYNITVTICILMILTQSSAPDHLLRFLIVAHFLKAISSVVFLKNGKKRKNERQ